MRRIGILAFIILLTVCSIAQPGLKQSLDSIFHSRFQPSDPGGSVQIRKQGKIIYSISFGLADLKTHEPFTASTLANVGSITKTFVAYAILKLEHEGKLSLDDNLLKYFPDFRNPVLARRITIRHLLTHTSGLPDSRETEKDSVYYLTAKDAENFAPLKNTDSLEFEPGSAWNYSNPAYNGLALIIEKLTGKPWQQYIIRNIFEPSGMQSSKITDGPYPESGVSHGYRFYKGAFEEYDYGEYPTFAASGNGGVWSSVKDLTRYIDAIHACKFLDCSIIRLSQQIWQPKNWASPEPPIHSYCWFVHEPKEPGKQKVVEHAGFQGGFRSHIILYPEPGIDIIWICNNDQDLTALIIPELLKRGYINQPVYFH